LPLQSRACRSDGSQRANRGNTGNVNLSDWLCMQWSRKSIVQGEDSNPAVDESVDAVFFFKCCAGPTRISTCRERASDSWQRAPALSGTYWLDGPSYRDGRGQGRVSTASQPNRPTMGLLAGIRTTTRPNKSQEQARGEKIARPHKALCLYKNTHKRLHSCETDYSRFNIMSVINTRSIHSCLFYSSSAPPPHRGMA
jgi:hypothetical protein